MLSAGVLIAGKYRIIRKLGEGAMGSVWLAQNETTEREFAIKVLLPQAAASPNALARFLREAKVCGTLRHPSILEIYDAGRAPELGDAPYLVMERLDGAPIDLVLRQRGAFPIRVALDIVAQIARGLFLAHSKGIIHRDLKPANVFLHRPGTGALQPKVLDFGISKIIDRTTPQIALTSTAAFLGSPLYMSPEQMGGEVELDARSDVHALGVLLWECLTGRAPFNATSYNLLVVEIMKGPRPKLRDVMPSASSELGLILDRSFAIDPSHRFASAAELADAIEALLAHLGGGVLSARTAALDVLGSLDLASKPPPSPQSSTTGPLSVDPHDPAKTDKTQLSAQSPVTGSGPTTSPRSSATSFAETEVAAGIEPRARRAEAVSEVREPPAPARSKRAMARIAGAALAVAVVAGAVAVVKYRGGDPRTPVVHEPASSFSGAAAIAPVPPTPPVASSAAAPSAAPVPSVAVAAPSASASAAAPPVHAAPTRRSAPRPAASATVSRPRIDQSGL
jgi:serine/threonine protein kinase